MQTPLGELGIQIETIQPKIGGIVILGYEYSYNTLLLLVAAPVLPVLLTYYFGKSTSTILNAGLTAVALTSYFTNEFNQPHNQL